MSYLVLFHLILFSQRIVLNWQSKDASLQNYFIFFINIYNIKYSEAQYYRLGKYHGN